MINIMEPDAEYQTMFVSEEVCFHDIVGPDTEEVEDRLKFYYKGEVLTLLSTPIWQFIDMVKQRYPGWPDEWPPEH